MDPVHFSGLEVLEMAERIEENGESFYAEAAAYAKSEELVNLFEFLAREETKHRKYFEGLKKEAADETTPGVFDPYTDEARLYIKALSDSEVFKRAEDVTEFEEIVSDEGKALEFAIRMEKDSLLFYHELSAVIRESDRGIIEKLIKEEKDHLRRLTEFQTSGFSKTS